MRALLAGAEADVLVTAHVHLQFERTVLGITSMNAGSVGLQYGGTPAAYWAEIGPEIGLRRTEFDLDEAERRTRKSGIPAADRIVQTLREPPSTEEVIEHAERLVASTEEQKAALGTRDRPPARCWTNSPHTRHSRLAPRSSAKSSCSSVRLRVATSPIRPF